MYVKSISQVTPQSQMPSLSANWLSPFIRIFHLLSVALATTPTRSEITNPTHWRPTKNHWSF